jgi:co-chaperonin GroES (HSP10)
MALNVKPLGDRILVEAIEEKEVKKGGIIIPDSAKEKPTESIVVALGTGKLDDNGKRIRLKSKRATASCAANTAARKSRLTARNTRFCPRTTSWPFWNNSQTSTNQLKLNKNYGS